jgi:hypothetical protein
MGARNMTLGLVFLMVVLALTVFAAKRLLFRDPATNGVAALLEKAKPIAKPPQPKPSAAVPLPSAAAPSSSASSSSASSTPSAAPATASNAQPLVSTPASGDAVARVNHEPSPTAKSATAIADRPQLRFESGVRLWIHVTAISRKPDGSFMFRGTLLQPVELANANRLDQGTELSGAGAVNNGHVTVLVKDFTVGGASYALLQNEASRSNKRPGTGLAVELDPGKLLEVWLASSSVYKKTRN